jgi:hypothetical protein
MRECAAKEGLRKAKSQSKDRTGILRYAQDDRATMLGMARKEQGAD